MTQSASMVSLVLAIALAFAGCGGDDNDGAVQNAGSIASTSVPPTTQAPATSIVAASSSTTQPAPAVTTTRAPALSSASRLRIDGLGPVDVGMTVAQARAVAGVELSLKHEPYCDVLTAPRGPAGVSLIVTTPANGRIELIIVKDGPIATLSGIRVGSTEAQVVAAYPGRLRSVNSSLPVRRLIYQAVDPALANRVLVFVIDAGRVATMYTGLRDQAEADEICA